MPLSEFNVLAPETLEDPFPFYRALHAEAPVYAAPGMKELSRLPYTSKSSCKDKWVPKKIFMNIIDIELYHNRI